MKRFSVIPLLLVFIVFSVSAQEEEEAPAHSSVSGVMDYISINSYGYAAFDLVKIIKPSDGDLNVSSGIDSENDNPNVGLTFTMNTPDNRLGAVLSIVSSGESFASVDSAELWVMPFSWVRLDFGKFYNDDLRGSMIAGGFNLGTGSGYFNEDSVFQRFDGSSGTNVLLKLTPAIEGLSFYAFFNPLNAAGPGSLGIEDVTDSKTLLLSGQYAAAYDFWNVGLFRLQYIGGEKERIDSRVYSLFNRLGAVNSLNPSVSYPMSVQAAAAISLIQNLSMEFGVTYPLYISDESGSLQRPLVVSAGGKYTLDSFSFSGVFTGSFLGSSQENDYTQKIKNAFGNVYGISLGAAYNAGLFSLGMNFKAQYKDKDKSNIYKKDDPQSDNAAFSSGVSLWISKTFLSGYVQLGVNLTFPALNAFSTGYSVYDPYSWAKPSRSPWIITVPISFSYYI
ncbi:hypothetical protein [Leadbettera azotonutricia]|uniref:Uncharacterized protein n=1 Tax=Leadbettera azotonutricia (strain ATCC BAA-888 / DSM 13862 / ZAS-9) TaxID=545695 RepID=F5Y750_LEAAZ|nr:hypothetical protein [Leadbettera azotonutricia]AEF81298.1 hypothetical protein TREAZ_1145 [Leadbettera azotonutricia ZAS-9]